MEQIKPCPFCGAGKKHIDQGEDHRQWEGVFHYAYCKVCEASGPIIKDNEEMALKMWNKRIYDD